MSPMTYSEASCSRAARRHFGSSPGRMWAAISSTTSECWATEKACSLMVWPFQRATRAGPWAMSSISMSNGDGSSRSRRRPDSIRCQARGGLGLRTRGAGPASSISSAKVLMLRMLRLVTQTERAIKGGRCDRWGLIADVQRHQRLGRVEQAVRIAVLAADGGDDDRAADRAARLITHGAPAAGRGLLAGHQEGGAHRLAGTAGADAGGAVGRVDVHRIVAGRDVDAAGLVVGADGQAADADGGAVAVGVDAPAGQSDGGLVALSSDAQARHPDLGGFAGCGLGVCGGARRIGFGAGGVDRKSTR